jgi:hypothetical protein
MSEQMALGVLRTGGAEIGADAPIGGGTFRDRPIFDRHAAQQHKAPPVEHLATQPIEHRSERRQRKVVAADLGEIETARSYCFSRRLDLGNLGQ